MIGFDLEPLGFESQSDRGQDITVIINEGDLVSHAT
jgi:hypothetical protein